MNNIDELKEQIKKGNVLFGMKQYKKHEKEIKKVYVPANTRPEVLNLLDKNKTAELGLAKEEAAEKLEIGFLCEVFSLFDKMKISEKKIEKKAEAKKKTAKK